MMQFRMIYTTNFEICELNNDLYTINTPMGEQTQYGTEQLEFTPKDCTFVLSNNMTDEFTEIPLLLNMSEEEIFQLRLVVSYDVDMMMSFQRQLLDNPTKKRYLEYGLLKIR